MILRGMGRVLRRVGIGAVLVGLAMPVLAERAPVVDSLPMGGAARELPRGSVPPAQSTPYYGPASQMNPQAELLYQLDLLQQEVQNLRGQVEQYVNDISRLRQEGTTRYRGLDERLLGIEKAVQDLQARPATPAAPAIDAKMLLENPELLNDPKILDALDPLAQQGATGNPAAEAATTAAATAASGVAPEDIPQPRVTPVPPEASPPATEAAVVTSASVQAEPLALPDDEQAAYEMTRALIKQREFPQAAATLQTFIQKFPGGQYEGHAWYWLGEVYMVIPDPVAAKSSFNHLLTHFSGHAKEADATYKLAVVHDQLGDPGLARSYFERVVSEHPGSSAASLASNYMRFMRPVEPAAADTAEGGN